MTEQTLEVKKKKGRPKKAKDSLDVSSSQRPPLEQQDQLQNPETTTNPEPTTNCEQIEEKKKRGRKKKEHVEPEVKQKKKRGRKAAVKYFRSSIRKKIPLTTVIQDNENYILHLDVNEDVCRDSQFSYSSANNTSNVHNEIEKEIVDLLENDDSILNDFLEKCDITSDSSNEEEGLRDLYEKRIRFRESQDQALVAKLETIHKDDSFLENVLMKQSQSVQTTKDETKDTMKDQHRKKGYFNVMYDYVYADKWLESTDISCWWCCHQFECVPVGVPVDFKNHKFRVKGVFCSFACAHAYMRDQRMVGKEYLLNNLYKKVTGEILNGRDIPCAPPRCCLKMFGGELSIQDFRNSTTEHKKYKMVEYPMFASRDYVEEIDIANVKNANLKVFSENNPFSASKLDDRRVEEAKTRLTEIRNATVTIGNTIDQFISIS